MPYTDAMFIVPVGDKINVDTFQWIFFKWKRRSTQWKIYSEEIVRDNLV